MKNLELKVPPVVVVFLTAIIMWLITLVLPFFNFQLGFTNWIALGLVMIGFVIIWKGVTAFTKVKTTTNPMNPNEASSLVSGGIYGFSRNPMYLGFAVVLLGSGFYLSNGAAIVLSGLFILYMNRFQIGPEERVLEDKFGEGFRSYKNEVRRWL